MQPSISPPCVMRLYSGPLQGCEFLLEQPCTLFVTAPQAQAAETEWALQLPESAIYLPTASLCNNFEILLPSAGDDEYRVRELGEPIEEQVLPFQKVHHLAGVTFALRLQEQEWDPLLMAPRSLYGSSSGLIKHMQPRRAARAVMAAVVLLAGALVVAWFSFRENAVHSVEKLVAGAASPLQIVHGNDRTVYVFAENERDLAWARQVMTRNGHAAAHVSTPYLEVQRLQRLLAERMPSLAWHRIDFSDVRHPRLWISTQRNRPSRDFDRALETLLHEAAPYAQRFSVERADDQQLIRLAEQALAQLALPYEISSGPEGVTFTLRGSLHDTQLSAVRGLVTGFYRQWGDRYVHFAVELKDDWLQNKSFQYGPHGYIKMTPSSWYFPKPL